MIYIAIASILVNIVLVWIVINLFRQTQQLESYINDFNKIEDDAEKFYRVILGMLTHTYSELQRIDKLGTFSSDDEVGFAFRVIITAIDSCKKSIEQLRREESSSSNAA